MELAAIANDPVLHLSLADTALALGVRKNYLIYWFSDLCRTVSAKYKKEMRRQAELRWKNEEQVVRDVVAGLLNEGIYPSRKNVNMTIKPLCLRKYRLGRVYLDAIGGTKCLSGW